MSALNRPDNFKGRVAYAAEVIGFGRTPTRAFDNCFENDDGAEVAVIIYRRSLRNPRIERNIWRYLNEADTMKDVARLAHVRTPDMADHAAASRAARAAQRAAASPAI